MKRDTNLIEAEGLALAREGRLLLQGLDFAVPAGKLLCITGENGAGKTTLLHALLGELPPGGQLQKSRLPDSPQPPPSRRPSLSCRR